MRKLLALAACGVLALGAAACGDDDSSSDSGGGGGSGGGDLSGSIRIDGSSTVGPFAQAAAEGFQGENPGVKITVGTSGTGGGFEKFCAGETDISDASRPIDEEEEVPICKKNKVTYKEVQVANDGISIVTNKGLQVDCMTVDQLKELWEQGSKVQDLSAIDPKLPDTQLSLFGPGTDSGTFEFFTEEVNGEEGNSRKDYQPSEDDNVLVQGVEGEDGGLGYFGFSYYEQNADNLGLVSVDAGERLRRAQQADDRQRRVQAPVAAAVHVPEREGAEEARGQGLHGLRGAELRGDLRGLGDRPHELAAGQQGHERPGRELGGSRKHSRRNEPRGAPQPPRGSPALRGEAHQGSPRGGGRDLDPDHHRDRALAGAGDDRLLR